MDRLRPAVRDLTAAVQLAGPEANPAVLVRLHATSSTLDSVCGALEPGDVHWTSPLTRELGALCAALAEATGRAQAQVAALEQQQRSDAIVAVTRSQFMALSMSLNCLVELLELGAPLPEADVVRALTAVALSMDVLPRMLRLATPSQAPRIATVLNAASHPVSYLLRLSTQEPSPLPPRALAIFKAVHLRPDAVLRFLEATVPAAHAHVLSVDTSLIGPGFMTLLNCFVVDSTHAEAQEGLRQRPELQRQVVQLAARGMCAPCPQSQAAEGAAPLERIPTFRYSALLVADCLAPARWQYEAAASEGASLLNRAAELAASPAQRADDTQYDTDVLRLSCLDLSSVLMRNAMAEVHGGSTLSAALVRRLLASLGTCVPLLADMASAVAAAGPPGAVADSGRDSGSSQFGRLCWGQLRSEWTGALASFSAAVICLRDLDSLYEQLSDASGCAAAGAASIGLLRLAPLLPCQPGDGQPGSSVTVATAVAAMGGETAVLAKFMEGVSHFVVCAAVSFPLPEVACRLLAWPASVFPQLDGEHAALAFTTLSATCRYAHSLAAELARAATRAPGKLFFVDPDTSASLTLQLLHIVTTRAIVMHHLTRDGEGRELAAGLTAELAQSRLECILLLCLPVVAALPRAFAGSKEASKLVSARCQMLNALLVVKELHPLWSQLLGPAAGASSTPRAGGGTATLLASTASECLQEAVACWPRLPLAPGALFACAMQVLWNSTVLGREAMLSAISRDVGLLRVLCQAGKMLLEEIWDGQAVEAKQQYERVWQLLDDVAHTSLGADTPLLAHFTGQPVYDRQAAGQAFEALLAELNDSWGSGDVVLAPPSPDAAAAGQLAVRCARALALRNCAHPCCPNLAASSGAVRGRRCSGCRVVRYCSERCGQADWRGHKAACRLLQAEQEEQGRAEQQGPS